MFTNWHEILRSEGELDIRCLVIHSCLLSMCDMTPWLSAVQGLTLGGCVCVWILYSFITQWVSQQLTTHSKTANMRQLIPACALKVHISTIMNSYKHKLPLIKFNGHYYQFLILVLNTRGWGLGVMDVDGNSGNFGKVLDVRKVFWQKRPPKQTIYTTKKAGMFAILKVFSVRIHFPNFGNDSCLHNNNISRQ